MTKRNRKIDAPISMEEVEAVQAVSNGLVPSAPVPLVDEIDADLEEIVEDPGDLDVASYLSEGSEDLVQGSEPVQTPSFEEDAPRVEEMSGYPMTIKGLLDFAAQVIMTGVSTAELVEAVQKTFLVGSHGSEKSPKAKANPTYTLVNKDFGEVKMATQAKAILQVLRDNGGSMSYSELVENLPAYVHTVQTPERLVTFYRGKLQENGFLFIQ